AATLPPSGCPRRRSSRHSASCPVGGPSSIRPAVQTHRPRPFTFATPLSSSHHEVFSPAPATNTGHCPFFHNGSSTNTSVVVLKPVPHATSVQALLMYAYTKSTTLATLLVLALAYFLINNPIATSWGKGSHVEAILVLTRCLYSSP
uniref:Uncharacterized protein n=1 Tax=Triticum urartu TaxID=4572 RepID=A0A8R7QHZ9_TRIUA